MVWVGFAVVVTWVAGTAAVVLGGGVSSEDEEDEV
jgi:hypothetical protein